MGLTERLRPGRGRVVHEHVLHDDVRGVLELVGRAAVLGEHVVDLSDQKVFITQTTIVDADEDQLTMGSSTGRFVSLIISLTVRLWTGESIPEAASTVCSIKANKNQNNLVKRTWWDWKFNKKKVNFENKNTATSRMDRYQRNLVRRRSLETKEN